MLSYWTNYLALPFAPLQNKTVSFFSNKKVSTSEIQSPRFCGPWTFYVDRVDLTNTYVIPLNRYNRKVIEFSHLPYCLYQLLFKILAESVDEMQQSWKLLINYVLCFIMLLKSGTVSFNWSMLARGVFCGLALASDLPCSWRYIGYLALVLALPRCLLALGAGFVLWLWLSLVYWHKDDLFSFSIFKSIIFIKLGQPCG